MAAQKTLLNPQQTVRPSLAQRQTWRWLTKFDVYQLPICSLLLGLTANKVQECKASWPLISTSTRHVNLYSWFQNRRTKPWHFLPFPLDRLQDDHRNAMDFVSTGHPKNRPGPRKYIHDHPWSSMRIRPLSGTKNAWHSSGNCSIRGFRSASLSLPRWWKQSTQQHTRASARLMADDFLLSMSTPNWKTLATNAHVTVKTRNIQKVSPDTGSKQAQISRFPMHNLS